MSEQFDTGRVESGNKGAVVIAKTTMHEEDGIIEVAGAGTAAAGNGEVIGLDVEVRGSCVHFDIFAGEGKARLSDIVPLARRVSAKVCEAVLSQLRAGGKQIPCAKGCWSCCSRCIVPLSVPEALNLQHEIERLPAWRRSEVERSLIRASERLLRRKPPGWFEGEGVDGEVDLNRLANWYAGKQIGCAFLYKGECTIYSTRPLACREYFVEGSARKCRGGRGAARVVDVPVRMVDVLAELAAELEGQELEAVMLPLVPVWYGANKSRDERRWDSAEIAEKFVTVVKRAARESAACFEVPV